MSPTDIIAAVVNDFNFRLLIELSTHEPAKNHFISPFSVAAALSMTCNGAAGATRTAMAEGLGLDDLALEQVNAAYHHLLGEILAADDPDVQVAVANAVASREPLAADFAGLLRNEYLAEFFELAGDAEAAACQINGWVASKTNDKIQDLVTAGDLAGTILALLNAVYFKGRWTHPFQVAETHDRTFTRWDGAEVRVPMMTQTARFGYLTTETIQAIKLPYGRQTASLVVVLPRHVVPWSEFQAGLSLATWLDVWYGLRAGLGVICAPRFRLKSHYLLNDGLIAQGMGIAFGPAADFSSMGPPDLFISQVLHGCFVDVDEEGTEAAGATAVIMTKGLPPPPSFEFVADHPFFAAIVHEATGVILFAGYVVDPTQE